MRNLTQFLQNNPQLRSKYVSLNLFVVDKTIGAFNKLMTHLMKVQGINPESKPGDKFKSSLNKVFEHTDEQEYDNGFNLSYFQSKYSLIKNKLHKDLSVEEYRELTDLSNLNDKSTKSLGPSEELKNLVSESKTLTQENKVIPTEKITRINLLAKKMAEKGLCENNDKAINAQCDELACYSDNTLSSLERVIDRKTGIHNYNGIFRRR